MNRNKLYTLIYGDEDAERVDPKEAIDRVEKLGVDLDAMVKFTNEQAELAINKLKQRK